MISWGSREGKRGLNQIFQGKGHTKSKQDESHKTSVNAVLSIIVVFKILLVFQVETKQIVNNPYICDRDGHIRTDKWPDTSLIMCLQVA